MKIHVLILLFGISCVQLMADTLSTKLISILPLQTPYDDFPQKDEMNAYIHSAFQYSSNQWTYKILPETNQKCTDVDCHFRSIMQFHPEVKLMLIPEVLGHGSFFVLNIKLVELPSLRIRQDIDFHFQKSDFPSYSDYKSILGQIAHNHFNHSDELAEYYAARPSRGDSWTDHLSRWWPSLLLLPIIFLYPTYGGDQ